MLFLEMKNSNDLEDLIISFIKEDDIRLFKRTKDFLSKITIKTDAFRLISIPQKRLNQSELKLEANQAGDNCELLKKNSLSGIKMLYIGCYYGKQYL